MTMEPTIVDPLSMTFSDAAAGKVKNLISEERTIISSFVYLSLEADVQDLSTDSPLMKMSRKMILKS